MNFPALVHLSNVILCFSLVYLFICLFIFNVRHISQASAGLMVATDLLSQAGTVFLEAGLLSLNS